MGKIRINELARELEVKPARLLELLPEFGITDKRTHSSSLEDDVANRLRRHFGFLPAEPEQAADQVQAREETAPIEAVGIEAAPEVHETAPRIAEKPAVAAAPVTLFEPVPDIANAAAPAEPAVSREEFLATRGAPQRLRPPLAGGRPPVEEAPSSPPARPTTVQAKPVPMAPRPGQILSGPRQPLPPSVPQLPKTILPAARAPQRSTMPAAPAAPTLGRPAARSTLAGQPVARPVVPPRPDLVARLTQPKSMPGQPQPRPMRPASTPIPGQPIYRGPIRPGQTIRPAGPGMRPVRGKTMHPTSAGRPDVPVALPTDPQRRPGERRPASRAAIERERQQDREEKLLRPAFRRQAEAVVAVNKQITIAEGVTVKELSEKLGLKANLLIKKLFERKIFTTINQTLDLKLAMDIAKVFGAEVSTVSFEEEAVQEVQEAQVDKDLVRRPPVVTVMGHVDHGKTSLLDAIRSTSVAEREAGGITQHIGAYSVVKNDRQIVFIDTPGHEAFTRMRARGAKVTDIVVLVVAADDGVMPQTLEAIDHARAAKVPIIVAVNKIDKPDAQPERVKQQLADRGLLAEDWGGDTVFVSVSARAKQNLDLLLEMVLLVADMQDLKANPARPGMGNVLEAKLDRGRGPVATVLVQNGTLSVGDYFICGSVFGKVRAMYDDRGRPIRSGGPSMPVEVLGLDSLPEVGDTFQVVTDTAKAKQIVIYREVKAREQAMARTKRLTLEELHEQLKAGEIKELPIILKTDVSGTAEVLSDALRKLSTDKVKIRVLHSSVGAITETDVLLASASNAVVIGFNVRPERNAAQLAERDKVDVRLHTIIYELIDEMKRAMVGLLEPVYKEVYRGRAEVRDTFKITKVGSVAGCIVQDGQLTRDSSVRVLRDNVVVHTGKIGSLRRFKNDVSEVKSGAECGVTIDNFGDFKPGDVFEAYVTERVAVETMA
jgi:translation initiation factor IF-2